MRGISRVRLGQFRAGNRKFLYLLLSRFRAADVTYRATRGLYSISSLFLRSVSIVFDIVHRRLMNLLFGYRGRILEHIRMFPRHR